MKKKILLLLLVALLQLPAEAKWKKKKKSKKEEAPAWILSNEVDSMSYALGINLGTNFKENLKAIPGGRSNAEWLIKAFAASLRGDSVLMTKEAANEYFGNYIAKHQALDTEKRKAEEAGFFAANREKEGIVTTESGLQYQVLRPAEGTKPLPEDRVKVHYEGSLINGTSFDSSIKRDKPLVITLNAVIPGWIEGLQLMSPGAKYRFFVPHHLGYGEHGAGDIIPPYSGLIFDVELLEINPENE